MNDNPIVYIVENCKTVSQGLAWLFELATEFSVATYTNGEEFLKEYDPNSHGCILTDIFMPVMDGFELLQELSLRNNKMPIIVMSGHYDIPSAVKAIRLGAIDFITKPFDSMRVVKMIAALLTEHSTVKARQQKLLACYSALTPREQEIIKHITTGKLNKQIASILDISLKTLESHRESIMQKMEAKSAAELIKIGLLLNDLLA